MSVRALVTGGCGFLGGALVRALEARGFEVRVLDLPGSNRSGMSDLNLEWFECDVRDKERVRRAVSGCQWVFHTAAFVGFWRGRNRLQWDVNVNGTKAVMAACLGERVEKVVHTSSINALGYPEDPSRLGDEESPFNWAPMKIGYMGSKRAAEEVVLDLAKTRGLPAVVVNPGTIFGVGPASAMSSNLYMTNGAKGRLLFYLPGGTNFVGLEEVVFGHLRAAEVGRIGERYILGGENLSYRELFEKITAALGVRPPRFEIPRTLALCVSHLLSLAATATNRIPVLSPEVVKAGTLALYYTSEKAQRELGFRPRPFDETLRRTIESLRVQGLI